MSKSKLEKEVHRALTNDEGRKVVNYSTRAMDTGSVEISFSKPSVLRKKSFGEDENQGIMEILDDKFELAKVNSSKPHLIVVLDEKENSQFDSEGFNDEGFNAEGIDREGFDAGGFNEKGLDKEGFNTGGYDADGFNREGINLDGLSRETLDK